METVTAETWLYGVLAADVTLTGYVGSRIYAHAIPDGATFPLVLITLQGNPEDRMTINADRIWSDCSYLVRGIAQGEAMTGNLNTIATRIDTLLHKQSGTGVYACVREEIVEFPEIVDNVQYRHLGGIYRIYAK